MFAYSPFFNLKPFGIVPSCVKPNFTYRCLADALFSTTALNCKIKNPKCLAFLIESITNCLPICFPLCYEDTA